MKRAENILREYQDRIKSLVDNRYLILHVMGEIIFLVCGIGMILSMLVIIVIPGGLIHTLSNVFVAILGLLAFGYNSYSSVSGAFRILNYPEKSRDDIIARLTPLFITAGLKKDDLTAWLDRVPVLPTLPSAAQSASEPGASG